MAGYPLLVASERSLLATGAVSVEPSWWTSSEGLVSALVRGEVDIAVGVTSADAFMAEARDPGTLRVFGLSAIGRDTGSDAVLVKKGSGLRELGGLAGRRIGVPPGAAWKGLLRGLMASQGIETGSVAFLEMSAEDQLVAVLEETADAILAVDELVPRSLQRGDLAQVHGSVLVALQDPSAHLAAVVSVRALAADSASARAVIGGLERAMEWSLQHEAEARRLVETALDVVPEARGGLGLPPFVSYRQAPTAAAQGQAEVLRQAGLLVGSLDLAGLMYRE